MRVANKLVLGASIVFSAFLFTASRPALAIWYIDSSGTLVQADPAVLGDSDEKETENEVESPSESPELVKESSEAKKKELERVTEQQKKVLEKTGDEVARKKFELEAETRKKALEKKGQNLHSELEAEGNKIKIKEKIEDKNGKTIQEKKTELPEQESLYVEKDGKNLEIKAVEGDELEINGSRVRTRTHFPLSIGADNALIITRKDGTQKTVSYLPDAAVANLEAKGFAAESASTELTESEDGSPVYKIHAVQEKKLLGLFPRRIKTDVQISAETGDIVSSAEAESSALARFLNRFTF